MTKPTLAEAEKVLQKYWGYPSFRSGQDRVVEAALEGRDTLVLFPTGGGKSLCYQVPAMVLNGLTIVISPLVALMQDQVAQLNKIGIRATFINSTIPGYEVEQRLVNARNGMYKLLYIAPERLATELWKREQSNLNIRLIAIDEAHCISEWGHNFRPSYRKIREEFGDLPDDVRWMALTATATPEVRQDLLENLSFDDPLIVTGSFSRPNLQWWVNKTDRKNEMLLKAVKRGAKLGSGIVYSNTRRDCEAWAEKFNKMGIRSAAYHAGMTSQDREQVQTAWIDGTIPVVVATNAFGMGIDKPDCRFVVHYTLPLSLEAYYQEAGRAGRDGGESFPVLIYKNGDLEKLQSRINRSYPEPETLIKTYNGICDELNISVGSFPDTFEPVSYSSISKRTGLGEAEIRAAVTILQRLEFLEVTELHEPQTGIHIAVNRDYLEQYMKKTDPGKADFLDRLIRQFGPVAYREMHFLSQKYLLEKLSVTENQLIKALRVFSEHDKLMDAEHLGEQPLIRLTGARSAKPAINRKEAYGYRDILQAKLSYMHQYAETAGCREKFLKVYFGEEPGQDCGHCDHCMADKGKKNNLNLSVNRKDIEELKDKLNNGDLDIAELSLRLQWKKEKVLKALNYLEREKMVERVEEETVRYRLSAS